MAAMYNRVALVVGGAKGIGFAIADRLAAEGAKVFITGRRADEVEEAAAKIGRGARAIVADAGDPADLENAVSTIGEEHDRIHALVLNAGFSEPAGLANETPEHFDRHFRSQTHKRDSRRDRTVIQGCMEESHAATPVRVE